MTSKLLLIPLINLPDQGPETAANPYPNRLPCGTPVAIVMNTPVLPDDDPEDEFIATGALIEYFMDPGDSDVRVLSFYTMDRIRQGVYSEYSTCLDLNTDGGMYAGVQILVRALGEQPVPTGHDFYRVATGGYWLDMGETNNKSCFMYFSPTPVVNDKDGVGWPTIVVPALADIPDTDPLKNRLALAAILRASPYIVIQPLR